MLNSNPIPIKRAAHKLENDNTKNILALLQMFQTSHQNSQPGNPAKGLGIPKESDFEGQQDLITGLPQDWVKQRLLEGTNKILWAPGPGDETVTPQETESDVPENV